MKSKYCQIYKSCKAGTKSFRLTQQLIQSAYLKANKIGKISEIILTIPANKAENYILRCVITKEKK